jgi:uncharacterized membrane protein YphA (DoxX/SURF4 family)
MDDIILLLARIVLGGFFVSYRFRWLYDPASEPHFCNNQRQMKLRDKLHHCGWSDSLGMAWFVAMSEILAGLGIIGGLFFFPSVVGILIILLAATYCTAKEKTLRQNPVDKIDTVNCYFWCPEPVYITVALLLLAFGPGSISLDHWVFG